MLKEPLCSLGQNEAEFSDVEGSWNGCAEDGC